MLYRLFCMYHVSRVCLLHAIFFPVRSFCFLSIFLLSSFLSKSITRTHAQKHFNKNVNKSKCYTFAKRRWKIDTSTYGCIAENFQFLSLLYVWAVHAALWAPELNFGIISYLNSMYLHAEKPLYTHHLFFFFFTFRNVFFSPLAFMCMSW